MKDPKITTDHDEIRTWIQSRGGVSQKVYNANALSGKAGLRIKFTNETLNAGRTLKAKDVPWEEFFRDFEKMHLAFAYDNNNENKLPWAYAHGILKCSLSRVYLAYIHMLTHVVLRSHYNLKLYLFAKGAKPRRIPNRSRRILVVTFFLFN